MSAIALLTPTASAQRGEQQQQDAVATVAPLAEAPAIDGKIAEGEWREAVQTSLFMAVAGSQRRLYDARLGKGWVGYDDNNLYVAVVSEVSPIGPKAEKKFRDARLVFDSGIELWIDPNRSARDAGTAEDTRFYQFIGNPIGTILDVAFDTGGSPDKGWDGDWTYENTVDEEAGTWTAELSLPWSSLGLEEAPVGEAIGLIVARNYKNPWNQVTALPVGKSFASVGSYPRIVLTEDDPVVRVKSMGGDAAFEGRIDLQVEVVNPGEARTVETDLFIQSTTMPEIAEEKTLELPANGTATYRHSVPRGRLHADAKHTLRFVVRDAESGEVYFRTFGGTITEHKGSKWNVITGPQPQKAARIAYYPYLGRLKVHVAPHFLGEDAPRTRAATVTVTGPKGRTLLDNQRMTWPEDRPAGTQMFTLIEKDGGSGPKLPEGEYTVSVAIDGHDEPLERTFVRQHFAWEGNTLGITDEVLPPFEPVRVEGSTVKVVQRDYEVDGLGLWTSVNAAGKELLASPAKLVVNGHEALRGEGAFTSEADHEAIYRGSASHPAVHVETKTITEVDGCVRVEMTLKPGSEGEELKSFTLDVPIRDELAPLFHVSTTALRVNPAGWTPKGEGRIWDTTDFPDGEWYGGFRPYVWLGGAERGVCWFADNDKGWVIDADPKKGTYDPAFSLHREDGVLTLRVHFVQKPVTLEEDRRIVFGLMASPAKPMPENWRAYGRPDKPGLMFSMGHVYGMPATFAAKKPLEGDFAPLDTARKLRLGENLNISSFLDQWAQKHLSDSPADVREQFKKLLRHGLNRADRMSRDTRLTTYFEEFHTTTYFHEEVPTFFSEWTGRWDQANYPEKHEHTWQWKFGIGTGGLVPSYRDFAVYNGAKWLDRGFGLYFDNAFPKRAYDTMTTSAYRLPDGTIQPSAGMWAHRDYLRRIWTLHQQRYNPETPQIQMIHMTNTHIIPYMVWNQSNLDLEWMYGPEPAQAKYADDFLLAEALGRQSGNIPVAIADVKGAKATRAEIAKAKRTRWGALLVHEIKPGSISVDTYPRPLTEAGYGLEGAKVTNYWADDPPITVSDERCRWLLVEHEGKATLLLATWNPQPNEVTLTIQPESLEAGSPTAATDPESGEALPLAGNTLTLPMPGYGVRFVTLN